MYKKYIVISWLVVMLLPACARAQMDVTDWRADIDFYAEQLVKHHIDPFHTLSQESFYNEIDRIKQSIPDQTKNQILVQLMKLTSRINDGHTSFPLWGIESARFPLGVKLFGEDVYVVSTTAQYQDLLGSRLISINETPVSDIAPFVSEVTPFTENAFSEAVRVGQYLPHARVLNGLGFIEDNGTAQFAFFDVEGKLIVHTLSAQPSPLLDFEITHFNDPVFTAKEEVSEDLWFGASGNNKTVYIKFRRYTSVANMESFSRQILSFINREQSENLIIDLRDNYGGDFFVGLKLAQALVLADSLNWKSGVYVLIDNVTYSAAMSNAAQFSQILNAKLVGSPTGARPSGYQDMGQLVLPNSGLEVTYSKRLYRFKDNNSDALSPDASVDVSIEDYRDGIDAQLRWVLNQINDNNTSQRPNR
ncbi:peptidase S41 [Aliidiomarina minuta]|uniref:Peptidase S41 n=1 Tax=Aliidiomarina minuta TaxID=880057 RepID=A0A432W669_9GAMM|nr:S41 family peptidase [Aliidiomarina minuta]RUO25521.1 peptidase S41 [Aliidiomarina minuta]